VAKGSPADVAGLCDGDVLVKCAGKVLSTAPEVIPFFLVSLLLFILMIFLIINCKILTTVFCIIVRCTAT
jgi:hypothetical protein